MYLCQPILNNKLDERACSLAFGLQTSLCSSQTTFSRQVVLGGLLACKALALGGPFAHSLEACILVIFDGMLAALCCS